MPIVRMWTRPFMKLSSVTTVAIPDRHCDVTSIGFAGTSPQSQVCVQGRSMTVAAGVRPVCTTCRKQAEDASSAAHSTPARATLIVRILRGKVVVGSAGMIIRQARQRKAGRPPAPFGRRLAFRHDATRDQDEEK